MHYFKDSNVAIKSTEEQTAEPTLSNVLNRKPKRYAGNDSYQSSVRNFNKGRTQNLSQDRTLDLNQGRFNRNLHRRKFNSYEKDDSKKLEQIQNRKRMLNDREKIYLAKKNTQENPIVISGTSYEIDYDDKRYRDVLQNLFTQNSGIQYEWFKEERGYKHWVLYRTDQFEVKTIETSSIFYLNTCRSKSIPTHFKYLHYKGDDPENVEFPVNVTTCFLMFSSVRFKKKSNIRITPDAEQCFSQGRTYSSSTFQQNSDKSSQFYESSSAKVIDFVGTFANAKFEMHSHFPKILNTESASKMDGMFYSAELLGEVTLPENFSTENVVSMEYMFSRAFLNESIKFSKGFNTENVFTMEGMFYDCSLNGNPFNDSSFNTKNVIDMSEMFNSTKTMIRDFKLPKSFSTESLSYSKHMFYSGSLNIQFCIKDRTNKQIVEILKEYGSQGKPL